MPNAYESARLILQLYELRREEKMRQARDWFTSFHPDSAKEIMDTVMGTEHSADYRMVTSYWEMAASLVVNGAIDQQMFYDGIGGEFMATFAKVQPHLAELRAASGNERYLASLEKVVMGMPDAAQKMERARTLLRTMRPKASAAG